MLAYEGCKDEIIQYLAYTKSLVELENANGYCDVNKECENFFCKFFNILFGLNFANLNEIKTGYPAVDLGDVNMGICIQITSDNSIEKIKETVNKYYEYDLQKVYDELVIFIIGNKKKYRVSSVDNDKGSFNINKVFDIKDLSKIVSKQEYEPQLPVLLQLVRMDASRIFMPNNYFANVKVPSIIKGSTYKHFIEYVGYKIDNDNDKEACDYVISVLNNFADTLLNLNYSTRQIIMIIIMRRPRVVQKNCYTYETKEADMIYYNFMDIYKHLQINPNILREEILLLEAKRFCKSKEEMESQLDALCYIDEYGFDILFSLADFCEKFGINISTIILNLDFTVLN